MRYYGRTSVVITTVAVFSIPAAVRAPAQIIQDTFRVPDHPVLLRPDQISANPYTVFRVHDVGKFRCAMTNWGVLGSQGSWYPLVDPVTGMPISRARFETNKSQASLTMAALWLGALVETALGYDTLVSVGNNGFLLWDNSTWTNEFFPDSHENGADFVVRSNDVGSQYHHPNAISGQDFSCMYFDTLTNQAYVRPDPATFRPHRPLPVKVTQRSYVWPHAYSEDFIVIQYTITNLRDAPLHELRVGILAVPNADSQAEWMVGLLRTVPSMTGHAFDDTVMAAWSAHKDGGVWRGVFPSPKWSMRGVIGMRFLGIGRSACEQSAGSLEYSFNWWAPEEDTRRDWGPQRHPGDRSILGGYGRPMGDAQKYRFMAHGEIDYDQQWANTDMPGWIKSPGEQDLFSGTYNLADGHSIRSLLSIGPFELDPGDSITLGVAIVGGDLLHISPDNRFHLDKNPEAWYENLDFSDLTQNLQWAAWVYDIPGVDSDGDGCAGRAWKTNCRDTMVFYEEYCYILHDSLICLENIRLKEEVCDSIHYVGDGVPDLAGPPPPPSPEISTHTEPEKIHIRWDGRESELFYDHFAQRNDFEGYNVYGGLGNDPGTLSLMASWDLVNYDRYRYIPQTRPSPWVLNEPPFTLKELYDIYGQDFDPKSYSSQLTYLEDMNGNRFYFKPHGGNRGNEYLESDRIMRNPIQYVRTDSVWDEVQLSWRHFGHYECTIDNLLPSQPYYFAVTAFDYGLPAGKLGPLESPPEANMQLAYPSYTPDYVAAHRLKVSVYPNPYKISARYRKRGFEDPNREGFLERERRIHFVNLPPEATIKIWSLDGDLIRELRHPESRFSDTPSHTAWDLITRNTQAVTSGIYLYTIESDWGTQAGKIVIIK